MKTKEQILETKNWSMEYPNYMQESEVLDAMDEYAKDVAIGFNKWRNDNRWFSFDDGKWSYTFEHGTAGISKSSWEKNYRKTDEELFNLYLKETQGV